MVTNLLIPNIGLGTWKLCNQDCVNIIKLAFNIGFTLIDTATAYNNHKDIAQGIKNLDRKKIFLISKINKSDVLDEKGNKKDSTENIYSKICKELETEYIDLILLHNPDVPFYVANDLNQLIKNNKLKHLGVSNFSLSELKIIKEDMNLPVFVNQIEIHAPANIDLIPDYFKTEQAKKKYFDLVKELPEMIDYCKKNNIKLMAHRPLAKGILAKDKKLEIIGKKYNKTASQVALRWLVQQDIIPIPGTKSYEQLIENLNIFDFELTKQEMETISNN